MRPPASKSFRLKNGDVFLLCSDGAWDTVDVDQMASLLGLAGTAQEWVESIGAAIRAAAKPNQDNYTAVGVWIGTPEPITVTQS